MFWGNIYFRFLCATKQYNSAEKFISSRPTLKNIRYLSEIYKRNKNQKSLIRLADKACVLYPNNKFGYNLKKSIKAKKNISKNPPTVIDNLADIISIDNFITIYNILKVLNFIEIKTIIGPLLASFSMTGEINIKKISSLLDKIDNIALKRKIYILLQRSYPKNHTFLLRLAEIYQDDYRITEAHILLSIACQYSKEYIPLKKFVFELENNMFEKAENTFSYLTKISNASKFKHLPMIKRVSDLFTPAIDIKMYAYEKNANSYIDNYTYNSKDIKAIFNTLVKLRHFDIIEKLINNIPNKNRDQLQAVLDSVYLKLGSMRTLVDIANINEKQIEPICLTNDNQQISYSDAKKTNKKCIEFYIPSVFFNQSDEKPTYTTVCMFYKSIYSSLHNIDDIVIIPFHQFNWRKSSQILDEFGISYHTYSNNIDSRWLHIQESVLNNCCSMDHQGFAGFSSLAHNFSQIEDATKNISKDILEYNFNEMHSLYVDKNISKYEQDNQIFQYDGKYIFLPMQVRTDIVSQLTYISCLELLRILVETCPDNIKIVVKKHPFCKSFEINQELEKLKNNKKVIITNCSIHSIIKNCDAVFTANSGVGFEAMMHQKPVYITGKSEYLYAASGLLTSRNDIEQIWKNKFTIDREKILRFLYYYNKFYAIQSNDTELITSRLTAWLSEKG